MLSVRLPEPLENQLNDYCARTHTTKSELVHKLLQKHLKTSNTRAVPTELKNPFTALRGTGNRKYTTDQVMRMTRGDDWNQP